MARVAPEAFGEREAVRVYGAIRLAEAQRVEQVLDAAGIDFVVEVEAYWTIALFIPVQRNGAGFYVLEPYVRSAAYALEQAGLTAGLVEGLW